MRESKVNDKMYHVFRGGSWYGLPEGLRSPSRFGYVPGIQLYDLGFRIRILPTMNHIIKGGSWARMALDLRSPNRDGHDPDFFCGTMGFRITMEKS